MSRKIVVDPARLDAASKKVSSQADDYERLYNRLFSEVDGMGAAWKGTDNQAFVTQIKGFMDDFQNMSAMMREYSAFLEQASRTYKTVQTETVNAARKLTN